MIYSVVLCLIFATKLYATHDNDRDAVRELTFLVTENNPVTRPTNNLDSWDVKTAENEFWNITRQLYGNNYPFQQEDLFLIISNKPDFFTIEPARFGHLINLIKLAGYIDEEVWRNQHKRLVQKANYLCGLGVNTPFNEKELIGIWKELTKLPTYADWLAGSRHPSHPPYWGVIEKPTKQQPPTYQQTIRAWTVEF